jgi:hypothetical protein
MAGSGQTWKLSQPIGLMLKPELRDANRYIAWRAPQTAFLNSLSSWMLCRVTQSADRAFEFAKPPPPDQLDEDEHYSQRSDCNPFER